jgi:hypothetical protein
MDPYVANMARNGSFGAGQLALPAPAPVELAGSAVQVDHKAGGPRTIKSGTANAKALGNLPSVATNRGQARCP